MTTPSSEIRRAFAHRRGTAYVMAVGIGLMVAAISLGEMAFARTRAASNKIRRDEVQARTAARSCIELARAMIKADPSWRTTQSNGAWLSGESFQEATYEVSVTNPAGSLDRSQLDSVVVLGDATVGLSRQRFSVQLDAKTVPLNCLAIPLTVGGAITATAATINPAGATLASNLGVTSVLSTIRPNVEAGLTIVGTGFQGSTTAGASPRTLPSSSVFGSYTAAGTAIPISALPIVSLKPTLQRVVLGPASNPYGVPNANGIYVIDCQGQAIVITNCRIVGTIVLLNPGVGSAVSGSVRWIPALSNYPCLLVNGNIALQMSSSNLSESTLATNFNPPGTPYIYPTGTTDTDTSDSYPSSISGLVYVSGNVSTSNAPTVSVLVVGGGLTVGGSSLTLAYDNTFFNSPPPGFYTVTMTPSQGSWRRVADDPPESALSNSR
ncbi:MAG: hypothetical protein JNK16_02470 [Phycisphaerales bacterium]|nr:hypothetical protein [Phycisphaerales bacterium]